MRQASDEAALLQRAHQSVHTRLGSEIKRILHLVEGWGDAVFVQALGDEEQQLALFLGEHDALADENKTRRSTDVLCLFRINVK